MSQKELTFFGSHLDFPSPALRENFTIIDKVILVQQQCYRFWANKKYEHFNQSMLEFFCTKLNIMDFLCMPTSTFAKKPCRVSTVSLPPSLSLSPYANLAKPQPVSPVHHDSTYPTCANPSNQPVLPSWLQQHPPHVHENSAATLDHLTCLHAVRHVTPRSSFSFLFFVHATELFNPLQSPPLGFSVLFHI